MVKCSKFNMRNNDRIINEHVKNANGNRMQHQDKEMDRRIIKSQTKKPCFDVDGNRSMKKAELSHQTAIKRRSVFDGSAYQA